MGIFGKGQSASSDAEQLVPALASGLKLTSSLDTESSLRALDQAILSFRPPKYQHLPSFVQAGWEWRGEYISAPSIVVTFNDRVDNFVLSALWPAERGSVIGLFRLGGWDERLHELSTSIIADWKSQDPSLSQEGLLARG